MDEHDIPPALRDVLRGIGLDEPDLEVPLHAKLVATLHRLGPTATKGQRLTALRFDFAWELEEAGRVFARAKTDYEAYIDRRTVRLRAEGEKVTRAEAEQIARAEERAYELKLQFLMAEQRERAMRNFLSTIQSAQDDARTDRADARAGNTAHANGYDGGA
ncbi:hypothetical protein [Herbiconiux sp. UC225_62]|uniref:hypothetical protein n=1 Tax=Herbiconiux sp. UC225_62 TaxID=3350168 RepID=UPI0036D33BA6